VSECRHVARRTTKAHVPFDATVLQHAFEILQLLPVLLPPLLHHHRRPLPFRRHHLHLFCVCASAIHGCARVVLSDVQNRTHTTRLHPQVTVSPLPSAPEMTVLAPEAQACSSPNPRRDRVQRPKTLTRAVPTTLWLSCEPRNGIPPCPVVLTCNCPALPGALLLNSLLPPPCICRRRPCCPLPSRPTARANFWSTASQGHSPVLGRNGRRLRSSLLLRDQDFSPF
jgi:hypothetical protein